MSQGAHACHAQCGFEKVYRAIYGHTDKLTENTSAQLKKKETLSIRLFQADLLLLVARNCLFFQQIMGLLCYSLAIDISGRNPRVRHVSTYLHACYTYVHITCSCYRAYMHSACTCICMYVRMCHSHYLKFPSSLASVSFG